MHHLDGQPLKDTLNPQDIFLTEIGNEKDYIATRVSYLLDFTGPSMNVRAFFKSMEIDTFRPSFRGRSPENPTKTIENPWFLIVFGWFWAERRLERGELGLFLGTGGRGASGVGHRGRAVRPGGPGCLGKPWFWTEIGHKTMENLGFS